MSTSTLSREGARRFYDRMGARQDSQAFYEDPAVAVLLEHGAFDSARRVFELGCGTGRFALRLFSDTLAEDASYHGVDLSAVMVELARKRLEPFGSRAEVLLTDGSPPTGEPAGHYDRFVSNYVLDLLSEADIVAMLGSAHRMLAPNGLLCVASLGKGMSVLSRLVARVWAAIHSFRPALVGGCRPLDLRAWLSATSWRIRHHERVVSYGIPSDVVVAERR